MILGFQLQLFRGVYDDTVLLSQAISIYIRMLQNGRRLSWRKHCVVFLAGVTALLENEHERSRNNIPNGKESHPSSLLIDYWTFLHRGFTRPILEIASQLRGIHPLELSGGPLSWLSICSELCSRAYAFFWRKAASLSTFYAVVPFGVSAFISDWKPLAATVVNLSIPLLEHLHRTPSVVRKVFSNGSSSTATTVITEQHLGSNAGSVVRPEEPYIEMESVTWFGRISSAVDMAFAYPFMMLAMRLISLEDFVLPVTSDHLIMRHVEGVLSYLRDLFTTDEIWQLAAGLRLSLISSQLPLTPPLHCATVDFIMLRYTVNQVDLTSAMTRFLSLTGGCLLGGYVSYAVCRTVAELLLLLDGRCAEQWEHRHRFLAYYWRARLLQVQSPDADTNNDNNEGGSVAPESVRVRLANRFRIFLLAASSSVAVIAAVAQEDAAPLGVRNELLQSCTDKFIFDGCVSSQDDRPQFFLPPWQYDGDWQLAKTKIISNVKQFLQPQVIDDQDRYLRFEFLDKDTGSIDDCEFYFTVNDNTIQFRSARRGAGLSDFSINRNRLDKIRVKLGFESIEVLRSRKRLFEFLESPLDSFGPPTSIFDRPEANMNNYINDLSSDMCNGVMSMSGRYPLWEVRYSLS